jgi:hypothetical protein
VNEARQRLPRVDPTALPVTTATAQIGNSGGSDGTADSRPIKAAAEFTRMKAADTPAAFFVSAHPQKTSSGVR